MIAKVIASHYLKKYKLLGFAKGICDYKTLAKVLGSKELQYDRKQMVRGGRLREAKHVQSFLEEDLNSQMCPGKKDHKRTVQKRILLFSMKDLHTKYTKEHSSKTSYSTFLHLRPVCRGVQYMHWVMHKCIMVKVGGKRNTRKVCKKQVKLSKTGGQFFKVGGNNNFRETGGKCTKTGKIGGKFEICGR